MISTAGNIVTRWELKTFAGSQKCSVPQAIEYMLSEPDWSFFVIVTSNGVRIINYNSLNFMTSMEFSYLPCFDPTGNFLACVSEEDGEIQVWRLKPQLFELSRIILQEKLNGKAASWTRYHTQGLNPQVGDAESFVRTMLYGASQNRMSLPPVLLSFSPDSKQLVVIEGKLKRVFNVFNRQEILSFPAKPQDFIFTDDEKFFMTVQRSGAVRRQIPSGDVVANIKIKSTNAGFSPDGKYLATVKSPDIHIWDLFSKEKIQEIKIQNNKFDLFALGPDGKLLALALPLRNGIAGRVTVWNTEDATKKSNFNHEGSAKAIRFSPSGEYLAIIVETLHNFEVILWELSSGLKSEFSFYYGGFIDFSIGNAHMVIAADNTISIREISTTREIYYEKYEGKIKSVALSQDGKYLAVATNTVSVWDVSSSYKIVCIDQSDVVNMCFSPTLKFLATRIKSFSGSSVYLWNLKDGDLLQKASTRITRNFTDEEWQEYFVGEPYRKTISDGLFLET